MMFVGSADVRVRRLRHPAEGIIAAAMTYKSVIRSYSRTSRRDAGWRRPRRSRSPSNV